VRGPGIVVFHGVTSGGGEMVGDSGAGGIHGIVPAPAAGDTAANKFLKADGTWAVVSAGGNNFTTFQTDAGTSPAADSATDTLTLTSTDLIITGDATTDTITLALAAVNKLVISGSRAAPNSIVAAITPPTGRNIKMYIEGNGGDVTATSVATASAVNGDRLRLVGRNDSKRVSVDSMTGVVTDGPWNSGADWILDLDFDGTNWVEAGRSEKII